MMIIFYRVSDLDIGGYIFSFYVCGGANPFIKPAHSFIYS